MKFEIEVKNFWLEDKELSLALKNSITREVVAQISKSIKEQTEKAITEKVAEMMTKKTGQVIDKAITEFCDSGQITVSGKPVPVMQHLRGLFDSNHGWNSPHEKMAQLAKKFGDELKVQYNNIFAGKIVVEMKNQGFLKDDMARILLGDKS